MRTSLQEIKKDGATEAEGAFREQNTSDVPEIQEELKCDFAFCLKNPQYSLQKE